MRESLAPLSQLEPPAELRPQNRRRIQAALGELEFEELTRGTRWWRRRVSAPLPLVVAALALVCVFAILMMLRLSQPARTPPAAPGPALRQAAPFAVPPTQVKTQAALGLHLWHFDQSIMIQNDTRYLGKVTLSGGELVTIDITTLARLELALASFRDARPLGRLQDGVIRITGDRDNVIEIFNVRNGKHPAVLPGGPYAVWVRWSDPSLSLADAARRVLETRRRRLDPNETQDALPTLEAIKDEISLGRTPVMSFAIGRIPDEDRLE